jgi:hypothetical protein
MTPTYFKTQCHYIKIYSNEKCICVTDYFNNYEIGIKHSELAKNINAVVSTKEEFEVAYNKVQIEINNIYENN